MARNVSARNTGATSYKGGGVYKNFPAPPTGLHLAEYGVTPFTTMKTGIDSGELWGVAVGDLLLLVSTVASDRVVFSSTVAEGDHMLMSSVHVNDNNQWVSYHNVPVGSKVIAAEFDSTKSYNSGDCCMYGGQLYQCWVNVSPGDWNSFYWIDVSVVDIINDKVGGGSDIDTDFIRPVFVQQMTMDGNELNYDARLENLLYKLPPGYDKVRGVKNISDATEHQIDTGISTDDGTDIEFITAFFIDSWVQYGQIVGNTYIDNNSHYFSVSCGNSTGTINCFVNTNYNSLVNRSFQNGSAICLRQTGPTRIAKDCYYPFNSYLAAGTSGDANTSNIKIFTSPLVTIYSLYIKKGGVVVRDFIPCIRLADNAPGFYDKISETFFTNDNPSMLAAVYP